MEGQDQRHREQMEWERTSAERNVDEWQALLDDELAQPTADERKQGIAVIRDQLAMWTEIRAITRNRDNPRSDSEQV